MSYMSQKPVHEYRLDLAIHYKMTPVETKAYYLMLAWCDLSREYFPDYKHSKVAKGDPRKTLLFRYCHTMFRDTREKLAEHDWLLYIKAQLAIFKKVVEQEGDATPRIEPNILVGPKAWNRWLYYKKKYDQKQKFIDTTSLVSEEQIKHTLKKSHAFLRKQFPVLTEQRFQEAMESDKLLRWIVLGQISQYYALVCPFIKQILPKEELAKKLNYDLDVYSDVINSNIITWFERELWSKL